MVERKKPVTVTQVESAPIQVEIIAESIVKISNAVDTILHSGLSKRALVLLLFDQTNVPKKDIALVLDALPQLRERYTTR